MKMKRVVCVGLLLFFLSLNSFGVENRYIVFFAETSDIPGVIADKIALSNRFCMVVPQTSIDPISENLEELISVGKIELAALLNPEPVLPILAEISNVNLKKTGKKNIFEGYVTSNLSAFRNSIGKENFGMFLNSGEMSHELLYYFADLNLSWVNIDNIEGNIYGVCYIDGITIFSLYKNMPYNQQEVMKWLESKHEDIIPVLLTKKHLQNAKFMEYIISLFDSSKYIKPATPLYIAKVKSDMLQKKDIFFKSISLNTDILEKLSSAAEAISNYAGSSSFSETVYSNAQSELIYLCRQDVLKGVSSDNISGKRMFDAAYSNIYRLLGLQTKGLQYGKNIDKHITSIDMQKTANISNVQTTVEIVQGGVSIYNDGLLKLVQVVSFNGGIKINLYFNGDNWNKEISFVDFYIDLNGISGMGGSSFIPGVCGFLVADSGWEYALRIYRDKAVLYKYSVDGSSIISNLAVSGNSVVIPNKYIRGNPAKWGFQAIVVSEKASKNTIVDFLNQGPKDKNKIFSAKPFQVPLVRH
jgi:hypothetical protein